MSALPPKADIRADWRGDPSIGIKRSRYIVKSKNADSKPGFFHLARISTLRGFSHI
jgi:hypothetical protein